MKKFVFLLIFATLALALPAIFIKTQPPQGKFKFIEPLYSDGILAVYGQQGQYILVNKSRENEQLAVPAGDNSVPAEITVIKNKPAAGLPLHGVAITNGIKIKSGGKIYIAGALPELTLLASCPAPETSGDSIIVDKNTNTLYFFKDGEIYKSYRVATGREPHFTPEGNFIIMNKIGGEDLDEAFGTRWMGLGVPCEKDNRAEMDHRAPEGLKYGIHGTDEPGSIGRHASGGCIRMTNQDISELYHLVKVGTRVDVVKDIQ